MSWFRKMYKGAVRRDIRIRQRRLRHFVRSGNRAIARARSKKF